jgi:hypothetical protein
MVLHKAHQSRGTERPLHDQTGSDLYPGALLLGLDLAKELDGIAAEERIAKNSALQQS